MYLFPVSGSVTERKKTRKREGSGPVHVGHGEGEETLLPRYRKRRKGRKERSLSFYLLLKKGGGKGGVPLSLSEGGEEEQDKFKVCFFRKKERRGTPSFHFFRL